MQNMFAEVINYGNIFPPEKMHFTEEGYVTSETINDYYSKEIISSNTQAPIRLNSRELSSTFEELLIKEMQSYAENSLFLLSGGMDSSVLYKVLEANGCKPSQTFSTSYPWDDKEKDYALSGASYLKCNDHRHIDFSLTDYFCNMVDTTNLQDDICYFNQTPLLCAIFKYAKESNIYFDSLINGMGADCFLGTGYERRAYAVESFNKKHRNLTTKYF